MYNHMLIPTDGSDLSKRAAQHGVALAKVVGARITAVTVSAPFDTFVIEPSTFMGSFDQYRQIVSASAEKYLDVMRDIAVTAGVGCDILHVEHEHPYQAIIDTAKSRRCDVIVMASHGRHGISAMLLGSETVKVLTHCTVPVIVYR
jgi:nucleotide-binding universal stress UspA family protein